MRRALLTLSATTVVSVANASPIYFATRISSARYADELLIRLGLSDNSWAFQNIIEKRAGH